MFRYLKKTLAALLITLCLSANASAQFEDFGEYAAGELGTIFGIGNAIVTFDYGGAAASIWEGITGGFSDGVDYAVNGGLLNDAEEFAQDIGNELKAGYDCFWDVTISNLPNIDPAFNRTRDQMIQQQLEVSQEYSAVSLRVHQTSPRDPRKQAARDKLDVASEAIGGFMCMNVQDQVQGEAPNYYESSLFRVRKQDALSAIADARGALLAAVPISGVPEGDIVGDFIPQIIRLLFGFASLAVFVAFVVAGLFFITAFGNEERITKAKEILTWTLVGFAFVVLAFAIVKAVTDIDFFGFI